MDLQAWLGVIFGVGGMGALTVLVTSYRRLKSGKITDDESLIHRLYRELSRQDEKTQEAERERDAALTMRHFWREQAWTYRLQLIKANIEPVDLQLPEEQNTQDRRLE